MDMTKFLSLLGLFAATSVFAQLTVKQDGDSETFIYVSDQVLYVADDISVTKKLDETNETAKAGIYLRDDAQLIQGNNVTNSGDGFISVYQDSHSDSYDYNYWSSPVSTANANTYKLADVLFDATSQLGARFASFNPSNSRFGSGRNGLIYDTEDLLTIGTHWLWGWNAENQAWVRVRPGSGANETLNPGEGWAMKGTNITQASDGTTMYVDAQNQYYEFRGRPNNGNISVDIQTGNVGGNQEIGDLNMTVSGNPYPSALDLAAVFFDNDNFGKINAFYFYDEDRSINSHYYVDNKAGYGNWVPGFANLEEMGDNLGLSVAPTYYNYENNGNQGGATGLEGQALKRRYAPIGQGFVIGTNQGLSGSNMTTVTYKNSHRTYVSEDGSNSVFRSSVQRKMVRFHIIFNNHSHMRDMILNFSDSSTRGFDYGMDADHPMDASNQEAYFTIQNDGNGEAQRNLVIQSVPFSMNMSIPIAFKLEQQGRVRIKAAEELNVPYHRVLILDTQDNMRYPIMGESSSIGNSITAQLTLPAGTYENRFFIVFEDVPEEDPEDPGHPDTRTVADDFDFVQDNRAKKLEVSNPEMYKVDEVNIYDMSGKLVYYAYGLGSASRYSFPTYNFADGVYMVRLLTENDGVVSYKMSVMNR